MVGNVCVCVHACVFVCVKYLYIWVWLRHNFPFLNLLCLVSITSQFAIQAAPFVYSTVSTTSLPRNKPIKISTSLPMRLNMVFSLYFHPSVNNNSRFHWFQHTLGVCSVDFWPGMSAQQLPQNSATSISAERLTLSAMHPGPLTVFSLFCQSSVWSMH